MKSKETKQKKVQSLTWSALPLFERWVNSKQGWTVSDRYIEEQIKAQEWEIKSTEMFIYMLPLVALLVMLVPDSDWRIPTLLLLTFIGLRYLNTRTRKQLSLLKKAQKLNEKLKKD